MGFLCESGRDGRPCRSAGSGIAVGGERPGRSPLHAGTDVGGGEVLLEQAEQEHDGQGEGAGSGEDRPVGVGAS